MLDLYLSEFNLSILPQKLTRIGSFDLHEYKLIDEIIDYAYTQNIKMNFFEDFFITPDEVKLLYDFIISLKISRCSTETDLSINKLKKILQDAIDKNSGIVGIAD